MRRLTTAALFSLLLISHAPPLAADSGTMVVKESATDFPGTVARLQAEIEKRGAKIVAVVDHAGAARANGLELRPTTAIIFGNPQLGTPLMASNQAAGLDLPLRMVVWQDASAKVRVGYWKPSDMAAAHAIRDRDDVVGRMTAALEAIAGAATAR